MATIGRNDNPTFKITVNPDLNRIGNPYFEMYLGKNESSNNGMVRIIFLSPEYIYILHSDNKSDKEVQLNSKYKKALIEFMNKQSKQSKYMNRWDYCKYSWNNEKDLF